MEAQTNKSEKYIFLAIAAFGLAGLLIIGYVYTYSKVHPDLVSPILLGSYLISISLAVFQSLYRNAGLSLLFSILILCIPLAVGASWMFPLTAVVLTIVAWKRRLNIAESIGRVGLSDVAAIITTSGVFAVIILTSTHDADLFLLWDINHTTTNSDPLFHAALSAMIKSHWVLSTGLDGLVPLSYHGLSHIIRAALSFGTGLPIIYSYGAMQLVIAGPLLLMAIVVTAETIRPAVNAIGFFIRILFLFIAFYAVNVYPIFEKMAVWRSYFVSDSYSISLILMLAIICAIQMGRDNFRLAALVALTLLCTSSKISTGTICVVAVAIHLVLIDRSIRTARIIAGIVLLAGWSGLFYYFAPPAAGYMPEANQFFSISNTGTILAYCLIMAASAATIVAIYFLLKQKKYLRKYAMNACALSTILIVVYVSLHPQLAVSEIQRFHFLQTYAGLPNDSGKPEFWTILGKFAFVHFLFTWILALLATNFYFWNKEEAKYLGASLLFSLVALSFSWAVLSILVLDGGSEYYFSNVAMFIALPFLLTLLSERINRRSLAQCIVANVAPFVVLTGAIIWMITFTYENKLDNFMAGAQARLRSPKEPYSQKFVQIISYLEDIRRDPATKNLGIYIAKEEKDFWDVEEAYLCRTRAMIIPAVSERVGLYVLPDPLKCYDSLGRKNVVGFGYDLYRGDAFEMSSRARISHELLMKRAVEAGFEGYVDVRASGWTVYRNDFLAKGGLTQ